LAFKLDSAIAAETIGPNDLAFAKSLLSGFAKYRSFTDRQRPHVERLVSPRVASPDEALAKRLQQALPQIPERDIGFATSLLSGYSRYGSFTDRQRPHVERLATSFAPVVADPATPAPVAAPAPPAETLCPNICSKVNLDGFSRFTFEKLGLSLKNDGSMIWVKWDGVLAGRIDCSTKVYHETRRNLAPYALGKAKEALLRVEADPLSAARENGVRTGRCSCCSRPLTDPVSIGYGIGPICRERGFSIML
jgi:hypothetical protein